MIYSVKGILTYVEPSFVVVECGGVGMKCFASTSTIAQLSSVGTEVTLLTYMSVKEDAIDLYGFLSQNELDAFKLLISVNGVGPKAAMSVLSALTTDKLSLAVSCGDVKSIQAAQGIGKKTAERIVLELKDKMAGVAGAVQGTAAVNAAQANAPCSATAEAVEVLVSLGFNQTDASVAVGSMQPGLSVDEMIRKGLKLLSSNL